MAVVENLFLVAMVDGGGVVPLDGYDGEGASPRDRRRSRQGGSERVDGVSHHHRHGRGAVFMRDR